METMSLGCNQLKTLRLEDFKSFFEIKCKWVDELAWKFEHENKFYKLVK
jgi:hypothetical protein